MISILHRIYNDEILYSIIARYHKVSGNIALKSTLEDVFGIRSIVATLEFPCHLEYLAKQIQSINEVGCDYLLSRTTLFPLYKPFLSEQVKNQVEEAMKYNDGKAIKYKLGFIAGGICKKKGIYYCPRCSWEEIAEFDEAYIHRLHQVQGIFVCDKHFYKLVPLERKNIRSRLEFIAIDEADINRKCEQVNDESFLKLQLDICLFVKYILDSDLEHFNQGLIRERYLQLLKKEGYMTYRGMIKQTELIEAFKLFYGDKLLNMMESNINLNSEHTWLHQISRKPKSVIHPIRHILFMRFLCSDPAEFFNNCNSECNYPFGTGPWPCLNICCKNYKKPVIKNCIVTADYKTREPVGTFKCKCGFTYSRKSNDDELSIGRIKEFGYVWENELKKLVNKGSYTLRAIARMLDCDSKTVVKYAEKLNIRHMIDSKIEVSYSDKTATVMQCDNLRDYYKEEVMKLMSEQPDITRQKIRKLLGKQYAWLYRNDKEWLFSNMPPRVKANTVNKRVNWEMRDNEICEMIRLEYNRLILLSKPVRITKSLLSRRIDKQELIEKWIDKLPLTKQLIESLVETVEQFQIRRIGNICSELIESGVLLSRWQIIRAAGLGREIACSVDEVIKENVTKIELQI